jgi:2-polyprenyl-3-methyl-5-hydroxy-6-metoxy-1,4-benzoquinol methylase
MINTEDLEFIGNVLHLQNNASVDLTLLKHILSTMRDMPELAHDIKDSFGRNQFAAKSQLIDLIDRMGCLDSESEVVIFGCWYGSVIIPKLSKRVKSIYGVDLDKQVIHIAKNKFWKDDPKVKLIEGDIFSSFRKKYSTARLFINTSCEHMPAMNSWAGWSKVSDDAYFAFQSNNMFGIQGHINCVDTIVDFKKQLPEHAIVLHQEELNDDRGTRFTLVGKIWSDDAIQQRDLLKLQKAAEIEQRRQRRLAEEEQRLKNKLLEQQKIKRKEIDMANDIKENGILDQSQTKMLEFINGLSILDDKSEIVVFGCKHTVELMTTLAEGKKRLSGFDSNDSLVRSLKHNVLEQYSNIEIIDADVITKNAKRFEDADLTINTICEHMPPMNEWESWKRFKTGSHVVFQSNNSSDKDGLTNCVTSLDEFKTQLPLNVEVMFEDESEHEKGTRYTIIGKITAA